MNMQTLARPARLTALLVLAAGLSACAQHHTLYNWQSYQPAVYAYLKDDGADYAAQAQAMEKNAETARSTDQALPPGFRAHLGMLYLKLGQGDKAIAQFDGEKNAFTESAPFMDFLMRNKNQPVPDQGKNQGTDPVSAAPAKQPSTEG